MGRKPDMTHISVCSFSTSLDDLTVKEKRDPKRVFDVIVANGRFSCFEIDRHLAKPVTMLMQSKYLRDKDPSSYPWCIVEATQLGRAWRLGQIVQCAECRGEGFVKGKHLGGRHFMAEECKPCDGSGFVKPPTDHSER